MRKALEESQVNTAKRGSFPAPVRGWNARDPYPQMKSNDAIYLDNFFPQLTNVMLRKGWQEFATVPADAVLTPSNIRTLMSYAPPSGTEKLFAATENGIYDVTSGGDVAATSASGSNGAWQYVNMTTAGGNFLWCCNGTDACQHFNGTVWAAPTLTGVTSTDVVNVSIFKNRLILLTKNSLSFYYLPLDSIAGVASAFPLGSLFNLGGYLMATTSWTLDAGEGIDDYFAAITSKGEVAVYKGSDPADAAAFSLVGIYRIPAPIGRRCFVRFGGDVAILTVNGIFPLSKALGSASLDLSTAFSDRIVEAWNGFAERGKDLFGWQGVVFPEASMLLVNVPIIHDDALNVHYSYQFVMNLVTGAWARFTNQHAECWCLHNGEIYFANHNRIRKAWTGESDGNGVIDAKVKTAFNQLGSYGNKRITAIRPLMVSSSDVIVQLGIDTDYDDSITEFSSATYAQLTFLWDSAKWDEAVWSMNLSFAKWRYVFHHPGGTVSLRLRLATKNVSLSWNATDILVEALSGLL